MRASRLLLPLLLAVPAAAQPSAPAAADTAIDRLFAAAVAPDSTGCAVAVIHDGRVVYERGYGTADLEHGVPITSTSVFHAASLSKQFTAFAILLLASEGKLSLDDDVRKHVPEVPGFGTPITLRHLLHHTGGMRDLIDLLGFAGRRNDDVLTEFDVLEMVAKQEALNFTPGTEHVYNNTGYILLGVVVKRVSGMPLPRFAEERIFRPLGMTRTRYLDDHATVVAGRATGYARGRDGRPRIAMPASDIVGSGGVVTTVGDLALWDRNFYDAAVGGPELVAQMRAPGTLADGTPLRYAGGLRLGTYRGLRTEEHNGADPGYLAEIIRFPDQRFTVAGLCNSQRINPIAAARAIADSRLARWMAPAAAAPQADTSAARGPLPAGAERLAGLYHDPGYDQVRRVVFRDGRLLYSRSPPSETALIPLGGLRFRLAGTAATEVSFTDSAGHGRPRMQVATPGVRPARYRPVDPAQGLPARLADYAGRYHSRELGATYRIGILDGELHWRLEGLGPEEFSVTFAPRFRDNFGEGPVSLHFERGRDGRVRALLLSTERARRVRFERVPGS